MRLDHYYIALLKYLEEVSLSAKRFSRYMAAFYKWITNAAKPASIRNIAFNHELAAFESNFSRDNSLKNGSAVKDWYYAEEWDINSLSEKIHKRQWKRQWMDGDGNH
uniref:Core-binding (CB) domain-containing protein n=1 Tax=Romanomermis culicivorax TaxID=13658 RepID=A0A915IEY2_ROMCU